MPSRTVKVLLVEENSGLRRVIRQLVGLQGACVQECIHTAEAIASYEASRPELVIIDIGTKDTDGIAVAKQINAMDPAARIILVSDYDDAVLRESARQAGACGYVLKDNLLEVADLLAEFLIKGDS